MRTLRNAVVEAAKLHHRYVGTEHVLLALTLESEPTHEALRSIGVDVPRLRRRLAEMTSHEVGLSDALRSYFELAYELRGLDPQVTKGIRSQLHTDVLDAMNNEYQRSMRLAREASEGVERVVERARRDLDGLGGAHH